MLPWWAMALKDREALSRRKEKHNGDNLKPNGKGMKVNAWPIEAAVGFLNRSEMEDKGQVGEDLTVNWSKSPPTGIEGDPAVFAETDHECKVLKGLVSISNPSLTGTEK